MQCQATAYHCSQPYIVQIKPGPLAWELLALIGIQRLHTWVGSAIATQSVSPGLCCNIPHLHARPLQVKHSIWKAPQSVPQQASLLPLALLLICIVAVPSMLSRPTILSSCQA